MLKSLRYQSFITVQYLGVSIGAVVVFYAANLLFTPAADAGYAAGKMLGIVAVLAVMMPFVGVMSLYTSYSHLALSCGATRRGFFCGMQATKLLITIGFALFAAMSLQLGRMAENDLPNLPLSMFWLVLAILWLSSCLGETAGLMTLRYGRWALLTVSLLIGLSCAVLGGVVGFAFVQQEVSGAMQSILKTVAAFMADMTHMSLLLAAAGTVLSVAAWRICRRIAVQ